MGTPASVEAKFDLLRATPAASAAVVIFDAFRCSSTLLACFAAGIDGAFVMEKGLEGSGTSIEVARALAAAAGRGLAFGGELHGQPMSEESVGNSPVNAFVEDLRGRSLHFQSTNFGKAFVAVNEHVRCQPNQHDVYVLGFQNCRATAKVVQARQYEIVFVVCAGFYDCVALEDMALGGRFIADLGVSVADLDDEAFAMYACDVLSRQHADALENSWTARVLKTMSKYEDVADVLYSKRIPDDFRIRMERTVLIVDNLDGNVPYVRGVEQPI